MTVPPPLPASPAYAPVPDPDSRRLAELNSLADVLPCHRRDELSALRSDADVVTLKHLVETGMGANTLRALTSDLACLERWCLALPPRPCPGRPRRDW